MWSLLVSTGTVVDRKERVSNKNARNDNSTLSERRGANDENEERPNEVTIMIVASLLIFVLTASHHRVCCERS